MVIHVGKSMFIISRTKFFSKMSTIRSLSSSTSCWSKSLIYSDYGEPIKVLKLTETPDEKPGADEITVKWLLAPVNPADINTIQGKYPSKPSLPAVPGNEGVGEIIHVGANVKNFSIGDRVVPNDNNNGTWRSQANYPSSSVLKIPKSFGTIEASMLNVNPCTAYRMLKDFVKLKPGDTVIQNGGNSAVGQLAIQLCKAWNFKSVNVVRDRSDISELKDQLKQLGADEVLTEAEIRTTDIFKSKKLSAPKLALNCIGGQNALDVLRHLTHSGTMVTYGGMSREPFSVPTAALIFKDVRIRGFWMTAWVKANSQSEERTKMMNELAELFSSKKLCAPPHKVIPLTQYEEAVTKTLQLDGKTGVKYILDLSS